MAISNLSTQYISASYQNILQYSSSGQLFDGTGTQVTNLVLTSVTASLYGLVPSASTSILANSATSASYATTASYVLNIPTTIDGNFTVNGTLTANNYVVSSSVINETTINVSGSTRFGNSIDDTHKYTGSLDISGSARFLGSVVVSGSLTVTSSNTFTNYGPTVLVGPVTITGIVSSSSTITGSLFGTASFASTASYVNKLNQDVQVTGSLNASSNIQGNKFIFTEGVVNEGTTGQKTIAVGGNYLYLYTGTNGLYINNQANSANNVIISDAGTLQTRGTITAGSPGNDQSIYFGGTNAGLYWASSGASIAYSAGAVNFSSVGSSNNMVLQSGKGALFNYGITGSLQGSASYALTASYALNGGGGGSTDTGSLLVTASVNLNTITFTKGNSSTFAITVNTGSAVAGGMSGSINSGGANKLAYYPSAGTTVDDTTNLEYTGTSLKLLSTTQLEFYTDLGSIYFGTFGQTSYGRAGFSVPGAAVMVVDYTNVRAGFGGGTNLISSAPNALVDIQGKADEVQLLIKGNGTQTANLTEWKNSGGTVLSSISSSGIFVGTASYALNGGGGAAFPYNGTASISGSLLITGSLAMTGSGMLYANSFVWASGDEGASKTFNTVDGFYKDPTRAIIATTSKLGTLDLSLLGSGNTGGFSKGLVLPTSQPANPVIGSVYLDDGSSQLNIYTTGGWKQINL